MDSPGNFNKIHPPSMEAYQKDFLQLIDFKEEHLLYNLDRLREYLLAEFQAKKEKAVADITKLKPDTDPAQVRHDVLHVSIPFTDFTRHMQDKLTNVFHTKQFYVNVTNDMINAAKMTEEEISVAKDNFNIVCNYKKRRENNLSCEDLYNEALVKYLVAKTFKKSATDTYNLASCFPVKKYFPEKKTLKVAGIGGGPGSDLTGLLNYLLECGYSSFECTVYDFNAVNWGKVCSSSLVEIIKKQTQKVFRREIEISIKWEFVDMKKDWESKEAIPQADVFSTCWALNECFFSENFWNGLIENNKESLFLFVDGESDPIQRFQYLESVKGRKLAYEDLENPRRLTIFPSHL